MRKLTIFFFPFLLFYSFFSSEKTKNQAANKGDFFLQIDGPYVLYRNDSILVKYVFDSSGVNVLRTESFPASQKDNITLHVNTDEIEKTFPVHLKSKLSKEKSEYKKASRLFILSDIEGNFAGFRKLLQGNGVINENYDWTFGNGELVLVGDFFDRGSQVTEVLWLIYSLEDKAKAAGGYVHFVLGNHEIMNLSFDLRYLNAKYIQTVSTTKEQYGTLYGDNSEIGRWLRTKNVIEKVGDMLFLHAGISQEINNTVLTVDKINELARPFYADTTYKYPYMETDLIMGDKGPFWYRGYYMGKTIATDEQIDSTLDKFYARHIVTGHTIVADTVSVWRNGKLFDTDVHHAGGKSEALLVEDKKFYRVNPKGEKKQIL